MPKNIVVFGPADAGKSTLVGYLIARLRMSEEELQSTLADIQKQMGSEYDHTEKFAYLVDTHKDERFERLKPRSGDKGHSMYMHMEPLNLGDRMVHVIDTPGAEHRSRDRQKGLFYGDIGVFMVDIADLSESLLESAKWDRVKQFLLPLFSSRDFTEGNKRIVVVLSKMDTREFSPEKFAAARHRVFQMMNDNSLTVIPVAIDVPQSRDHNVVTQTDAMAWFDGQTLLEHLESLTASDERHKPGPTLLPVGKVFDKRWHGLIAEGKLLSGRVAVGQRVKVLPVLFQHRTYEVLEAEIGNLRLARGEDIPEGMPGEIVAAQLHDMRIRGRRCDKSEMDSIDTTAVVDPDVRLAYGRIVRFRVEDESAARLSTLETIRITWFGKQLSSKLIHAAFQHNKAILTLEVETGPVAMPLHGDAGDNALFSDFLLSTQSDQVLNGRLVSIAEPKSLTFSAGADWDVENYFKGLQYSKAELDVTIDCTSGVKDGLLLVRRFAQRYGADPDSEDVHIRLNTDKVYK